MKKNTPPAATQRLPQSGDHEILRQLRPQELNILFVRHGQAGPGDAIEPYLGNPLTKLGLQQAQRVARRLAPLPLDHIYSSDFARSYQTAKAVAGASPSVPWDIRRDLREVASFHFPGRPPARTREHLATLHEQRQAAEKFIRHLRRRHRPGQLVAVVAHGGINRLVTSLLAGFPIRRAVLTSVFHCSVTLVEISRTQQVNVRFLNCTRHLPTRMITENNLA